MKNDVQMIEVDVWVIVNSEGESVVAGDADSVADAWAESDSVTGVPSRVICVKIRVPKPKATVATITLPEEPATSVDLASVV